MLYICLSLRRHFGGEKCAKQSGVPYGVDSNFVQHNGFERRCEDVVSDDEAGGSFSQHKTLSTHDGFLRCTFVWWEGVFF